MLNYPSLQNNTTDVVIQITSIWPFILQQKKGLRANWAMLNADIQFKQSKDTGQKCDIISFYVNLNCTQIQSLLLHTTFVTSQFAFRWRQILRRLCLAGYLNIRLKATPQNTDELCVRSLLRQVTSSVKVKLKVKFALEETTKAQRRCRVSVTGFYSEDVFLRHHYFTYDPDTFIFLSLMTRDLYN